MTEFETFEIGRIVITDGIEGIYKKNKKLWMFILDCLFLRYKNCDWGEMCIEDLETNDWAVQNGERIFGSYNIPKKLQVDGHDKFWIITEWDRSVTTILFPEEY